MLDDKNLMYMNYEIKR